MSSKNKKNSSASAVASGSNSKAASKAAKAVTTSTVSDYSDQEPQVRRILQVRELMMQRDAARMSAQFVKADQLRERLRRDYNVEVMDQPQQQQHMPSGWKFTDGTSKKLPGGFVVPEAFQLQRKQHEEFVAKLKSESGGDKEAASAKKDKRKREQDEKPSSSGNDKKKAAVAATDGSSNSAKKAKTVEEKGRNVKLMQSVLNEGSGGAAAAAAGARTVQGVLIEDLQLGSAGTAAAAVGQRVKVQYTGRLKSNGKVFDSSGKRPFTFKLGRGEVIRGWDIGVAGMRVGGKRRLTIPPEKAYGKAGSPPVIPPNATLVFDVTLMEAR